eukprot:EG_transcript_39491
MLVPHGNGVAWAGWHPAGGRAVVVRRVPAVGGAALVPPPPGSGLGLGASSPLEPFLSAGCQLAGRGVVIQTMQQNVSKNNRFFVSDPEMNISIPRVAIRFSGPFDANELVGGLLCHRLRSASLNVLTPMCLSTTLLPVCGKGPHPSFVTTP